MTAWADRTYQDLIDDAVAASVSGWDFSYLAGRVREAELPWSYEDLARSSITEATRVLDLNTGGGEIFGELLAATSPRVAVATEAWSPNVPIARERLGPRGVEVRHQLEDNRLPAEDAEFDLVLNRHGACEVGELHRVLVPNGSYVTQGVGRFNDRELNEALGGPAANYRDTATLAHDAEHLLDNGFTVIDSGEAHVEYGFRDIGTVVFHLRAVSWQIPGFDVTEYDAALRRLDRVIRTDGEFTVRHHRYYLVARRD